MRRLAAAVASMVLFGCGSTPRTPQGFARVGVTVGGNPYCLWRADNAADQDRGLMDVDSLGSAKGMLFHFAAPTTVAFYMFRTKIPLTVAFVGADGRVLSVVDMDPCPETDPDKCPRFSSSEPYLDAVEVLRGRAAALGLAAGTTMTRGTNCP